jgi:cyclophilin family peptidyl-prolyl cis-trans isomerase
MRKLSLLLISGMLTFSISAQAKTKAPLGCSVSPIVELKTNMGEIDIQLDRVKAPITVANFMQYVSTKFYDGKIFHRVIPGFMIQGGGFDVKMTEAETKMPIKNEAKNGLTNDKYTISMARTNDPDSATAQFFINVNDNVPLNYSAANPGYAVFGKVIKGQDIADKIAGVQTKTVGQYENVPEKAVVIKTARIRACK